MAVQFDEYTIGAIDLGGTVLHGSDDYSEDPAPQLFRKMSTGRMNPSYSVTLRGEPRFRFTTCEIERTLSTAGIYASGSAFGKEITTPVIIYWTKKDALARSAGADHLTTTINEGIIYPTSLSWNGEVWQLEVEILAYSESGAVLPFVFGTASLPTLAIVAESFTGGKATISTTEVDCWQDITLNFGVSAKHSFHKGLHYPTRVEISTWEPTIEINNLDPALRNTYGQYGTRITDFELFLRKNMTTDGQVPTRELDASLVHLRFDGIDGIVHPLVTTGSNEAGAAQGLSIVLDENAATAVLIPNYGVAIT